MRNVNRLLLCLLALLLTLSLTGCEGAMERTGEMVGQAVEGGLERLNRELTGVLDEYADQGAEVLAQTAVDPAGEGFRLTLDMLGSYDGSPWVAVNDNQPCFPDPSTTKEFEIYTGLDQKGRCGVAFASVSRNTIPLEERGPIGTVKPSGWQSVKYDFIDGRYLYNRCHLIGFQLTGENANPCNLITGTRYLNVEGMLPFENQVADYVRETGNHVLYRATPLFQGDELVARGVELEAWSVEDQGEGICFHVWCWNVQPGVSIDYATGESALTAELEERQRSSYILNTAQKRFHKPECSAVKGIEEAHKQRVRSTREELIQQGYAPCGRCKP